MKTITTDRRAARGADAPRAGAGRSIGLVPTMGAFHDGHLSLMRRARAQCDVVVVSLFVNPTQFNDAGDLAAYPRDERRDAELAVAERRRRTCSRRPCEEVYPPGFATTVSVAERDRAARGRAPRPRRTSTASRPSSPSC